MSEACESCGSEFQTRADVAVHSLDCALTWRDERDAAAAEAVRLRARVAELEAKLARLSEENRELTTRLEWALAEAKRLREEDVRFSARFIEYAENLFSLSQVFRMRWPAVREEAPRCAKCGRPSGAHAPAALCRACWEAPMRARGAPDPAAGEEVKP